MEWGMPTPRDQFAAINGAKNNAKELYDTLEALCTCLVMGIEEYVVRFDASVGMQGLLALVPQNFLDSATAAATSNTKGNPQAPKTKNPSSAISDSGDCMVVLLRCIGNIMELVPNSSAATCQYLYHLVSLLNFSFAMGSNLQYTQSNVLLLADEALKILSFLAVEDSGNVAYKAGLLPKALLVLTWGDARLTKRIFQTLALVCQRLTLTASDFTPSSASQSADGGSAKKDKNTTKGGKGALSSGNNSFAQTSSASSSAPVVPPHLADVLAVVTAAQHIISLQSANIDSISSTEWDAVESVANCLSAIVLRNEAKGEFELVRATISAEVISNLAGIAQRSDNTGRRLSLLSVLVTFCHCAPSIVRRALLAGNQEATYRSPIAALFKELLAAPEGGSVSHWLDQPFGRQARQRPDSGASANTTQTDLLVASALQLLTECLPPVTSPATSLLVGGSTAATGKKKKKDKGADVSATPEPLNSSTGGPTSFPPPLIALVLPRTWQWEDDLHMFTPYPAQECLALETALLSNRVPKVVVRSGGRNYEIDLTGLKQQREGGGLNRNVRRSAIPSAFSVIASAHRYSFHPSEKADLEATHLGYSSTTFESHASASVSAPTSSKSSFFSFASSSTNGSSSTVSAGGSSSHTSPLPFFVEVLSFLQRYGVQLASYARFASSPTFRVASLQALMQGLHWTSVGLRWAHNHGTQTKDATAPGLKGTPISSPVAYILEAEGWLGEALVGICDSVAEVIAASGVSSVSHVNPTSPTGQEPQSASAASGPPSSSVVSPQKYSVSYALAVLDRLLAIQAASAPQTQLSPQPSSQTEKKAKETTTKQKGTFPKGNATSTRHQDAATQETAPAILSNLNVNSRAVPTAILSALIRNGVSLEALQKDAAGAIVQATLMKQSPSAAPIPQPSNGPNNGNWKSAMATENRSPAFVKLLNAVEHFCNRKQSTKSSTNDLQSPTAVKERFANLLAVIADTSRDISPFEFTSLRIADAILMFLDDVETSNTTTTDSNAIHSADQNAELVAARDDAFAAALSDNPAAAEALTKLLVSALPFIDNYILVESLSSSDEVVCRGVRDAIMALSNISPRLTICSLEEGTKKEKNNNADDEDEDEDDALLYCPYGNHPLVQRTIATGWSCDECGYHSRGTDSLRCDACDYDICESCQSAAEAGEKSQKQGDQQKPVRAHMMSTVGDIEAYFCGRKDPGKVLAEGVRTSVQRLMDTAANLRRGQQGDQPTSGNAGRKANRKKAGHADPQAAVEHNIQEQLNVIAGPKRDAHVRLASGRLSLYYEGIGRCSYQETLFGMLYRKSFNRRLFPLVDLFESAIVKPTEASVAKREEKARQKAQQLQNSSSGTHAPPTSRGPRIESEATDKTTKKSKRSSSGLSKKGSTAPQRTSNNNDDCDNPNNESVSTPRGEAGAAMGDKAMTPCSPIGMGLGGEGGEAKLLSNRQRSLSFSAVPARRALFGNDSASESRSKAVTRPDVPTDAHSAAEVANATSMAMRDRVLCFHYFPSDVSQAGDGSANGAEAPVRCNSGYDATMAEDKCACGAHDKAGMVCDEHNQLLQLQLKPPAVESRAEIVLLQFLFEANRNAAASANGPSGQGKDENHLISEQSFVSRAMTDRIVKAFSASALRVALLDPQFAIPRWAYYLLTECAFLFTAEVRRQLAAFLAFGARRRLWEFMHSEGLTAPGMAVYPSEWIRIPNLTASASVNRALAGTSASQRTSKHVVDRASLLADAYRLVRDTAELRFPLSIEFKNEKGTGNGPTVAFFANVAKELCRSHLGLWRDNTDHGNNRQPNEGDEDDNAVSEGTSGNQGEDANRFVVVGKEGLFPAINPATPLTEDLFYVIGGVMARAYMDNRLFPIELSPALLAYLRFGLPKRDTKTEARLHSEWLERTQAGHAGGTGGNNASASSTSSAISFASESSPQHESRLPANCGMIPWQHRSIGLRTLAYIDAPLYDSMRKLRSMYSTFLSATNPSAKADAELSIEALDIAFTLPGHDDILLCRDGDARTVHVDNLPEYLSLVTMAMCYGTVSPQINNFVKGFTDVVPIAALRLLSGKEISQIVCGSDAADQPLWTEAIFRSILQPDHGYTIDSKQVQWLIKLVGSTFTPAQQRQFLEFCTGCPRVPIGGITQIGKIRMVYKEPSTPASVTTVTSTDNNNNSPAYPANGSFGGAASVSTSDADNTLVSVNTCFLYLKVPAYSSIEVLSQKLIQSITGSEGFDFS